MAILQCNKCANLFHDDAPHECDVERWQRLAHEGQQYFGKAIGNAPKPATPEPPEWLKIDPAVLAEAQHRLFTLGRSMIFVGPQGAQNIEWSDLCDPTSWGDACPDARDEDHALSRAMSAPLPHDPDIHTRLMPWRGKEE